MNYVIPAILLATFILAVVKKVNLFESFIEGFKEALALMMTLVPYLVAIFVALELMHISGLSAMIAGLLSPLFSLLGIPIELAELIVLRPLSGSGSLASLQYIYETYGVDSYVSCVASAIMGGTDTILYITAVYFSTSKDKRSGLAIPISLFASLIGTIAACIICKYI